MEQKSENMLVDNYGCTYKIYQDSQAEITKELNEIILDWKIFLSN